jgi:alpha-galactosidase
MHAAEFELPDGLGSVRLSSHALPHGELLEGDVRIARTGHLDRVTLPLERSAVRLLEHGWQSWSTVRATTPHDIRPSRTEAPRWFRRQMLLDGSAAGHELAGDTYLVYDQGVIGALSNDEQFTRVVVGTDGALRIEWLFDDIEVAPGDVFTLEPHVVLHGDPGRRLSDYAERAGRHCAARTPRSTQPAWCSWYQYFGAISPDIIRRNLVEAAQHGIRIVQIDDGWQAEIGVWTDVNIDWAEPLHVLANDIDRAGCTPGIWTAPFLAIEGGTLARHHPDWLVANEHGQPTTALFHGGWGGKVFALDCSNPEVLTHLAETYRLLRQQGFRYFKIDFLHAAAAVGARSNPRVTRAQVYRAGMRVIRDAIGEDAVLVGCGAPLLASVGIVDAMRVSEDVAPFYRPRQFFEGFPENTVAGLNALEPSLLRAPLHNRWFALDPDCVMLRRTSTELSESERVALRDGAACASDFIVLSDDLEAYTDDEWAQAHALFTTTPRGVRDLDDPFARPLVVRTAQSDTWCDPWSEPPVVTVSPQ